MRVGRIIFNFSLPLLMLQQEQYILAVKNIGNKKSIMEAPFSDDSCESEMKNMKSQLTEFGLEDENLSKEEMCDLLKALKNSKSTVVEDEICRQKDEVMECDGSPRKTMKRRYLNVKDRRMPWSVLPTNITPAEKARALAVYIKMMSINNYRQARLSPNFAAWPPSIQIVEETTRVQPIRSTRSGRSVPVYAGYDDDPSDLDFVITKTKKRKVSNSDANAGDGVYSNKVISLKRKPSKDENTRPIKEQKMTSECNKEVAAGNNLKPIKEITFIED